ncbi:MAG: ornithine--oxo-acid transaminase [Saprospiraceae bacterium]|nr:ornithine--oxo-acid transaminase [Saprospiraceae bacterium]HMW38848.1 ornithine--oxo-acid transaminase [Saprospiraceae bacterium]HMX87841.1 ornithine--oxo-acid transaminase [Saprospiraceae bacterium]HMZ39689.1 ornithine--oxo-acid transaminase [Saprospiraceae bacterium]HNA64225.1 ornithine--oxo-acid transaminase [Saprospiraceae bacterium]
MMKQQDYMHLEDQFGAHNYHPLPIVLERGAGIYLYDTDGKKYFDFLSAYSAVNQGHSHPRLIRALTDQAQKLTLTSRAFYNNKLGLYEQKMHETFGYDKVLPMNTGAEAIETAIKLCRKWAYHRKGLREGEAQIIVAEGNFHGRTMSAVSASTDPSSFAGYAPLLSGFIKVPYNDPEAFEIAARNPNVAGFLIEPIQGEAGVIVPNDHYLPICYDICRERGILLMADEIQTGIARTGRMLACDYLDIHPDILILGKALSGGILPVSAVLSDDPVMLCIRPGEHGSTFGGNPLACHVAMEALDIVIQEGLADNAAEQGNYLREILIQLSSKYPIIREVRGKGLLNAIELVRNEEIAWDLCLIMAENGLLAKPTHGNIIRLAPPLVISRSEIEEAAGLIEKSLKSVMNKV